MFRLFSNHNTDFSCNQSLRDAGVFRISITGGECLILKDILQIIDKIEENGMELVALYTNGWLVDEKLLDELEKRGMHPEFSCSREDILIDWNNWQKDLICKVI